MLEWPAAGDECRGPIDGPAGALEVAAEVPDGEMRGIAVICHPHPQYGGTLDNKVVFTLARAAREAGLASVRFNFRGVGDSEGDYAGGEGELEDARAVAVWARRVSGQRKTAWAGFSFGAAVALRAVQGDGGTGLITIALPVDYFDNLPRPDCPWRVVHGDADDVVDCEEAIGRLRALTPPPEVEVVAEAGHFFHGRLADLRRAVAPAFAAAAE